MPERSFVLPVDGLTSEVGVRRGAAYLRISSRGDPSDYAVVWTPSDRWFSLDVAGGFSYNHFEEDTPDADVLHLIENLVQAAIDYIEERGSTTYSRFLKLPRVVIETTSGPLVLALSIPDGLKRAFGIGNKDIR